MIAKNQWSSNFTMNEFEKALLQINTYNLPKTKFLEYIIEHVLPNCKIKEIEYVYFLY